VKAIRYRLKPTLREHAEVIARKRAEAARFVLLTNVSQQGEMAQSAREILYAYIRTNMGGRFEIHSLLWTKRAPTPTAGSRA
jgi:hypothetical protein